MQLWISCLWFALIAATGLNAQPVQQTVDPAVDPATEDVVELPIVVTEAVRPVGAFDPDGPQPSRWITLAGRLHPLVIHFPIALLFAAALAELLGGRRSEMLRNGARFCWRLGTLSALLAVSLGLAAQATNSLPESLRDVVMNHRLAGFTTALLALATLVLQNRSDRASAGAGARRLYLALMLATLVAVVAAGHLGGTLVFGRDHLSVF